MDVHYKNKKTRKLFQPIYPIEKYHGAKRAKLIRRRITALEAAQSLMDFWPPKSGPERCHELNQGQRAGQISMDLDHPYRLIFIPYHDPVPTKPDGGLEWSKVTAVEILGLEDTHG